MYLKYLIFWLKVCSIICKCDQKPRLTFIITLKLREFIIRGAFPDRFRIAPDRPKFFWEKTPKLINFDPTYTKIIINRSFFVVLQLKNCSGPPIVDPFLGGPGFRTAENWSKVGGPEQFYSCKTTKNNLFIKIFV